MHSIQIVSNADRFHVSVNSVPVATYLFKTDDSSAGVSKAFALMNAESTAYQQCLKYQTEGKIKLLPMESK